jgi:hypothetical protein
MAAPSFRTLKIKTPRQTEALHNDTNLAACEVHGDFKADTQVGVSRFGPGHGSAPFRWMGQLRPIHIVHLQPEMFR